MGAAETSGGFVESGATASPEVYYLEPSNNQLSFMRNYFSSPLDPNMLHVEPEPPAEA